MAGTIVADDIQHSTAGSVGTEYVVSGSVKYWGTNNGSGTVSVRDSLNQSSITDRGTGLYTMSMSSAFSNANHSQSGGVRKDDSNDDGNLVIQVGGHSLYSPTSSEMRAHLNRRGGTTDRQDSDYVFTQSIGDLA